MSKRHRDPIAFDLADPALDIEAPQEPFRDDLQDTDGLLVDAPPVGTQQRRWWRWGRVFWIAVGALVGLWVTMAVEGFVRALFARQDWLGWLALGLAIVAAVAAIMAVGREIVGIMRQHRIGHIRGALAAAYDDNNDQRAHAEVRNVLALYRARPDTASARQKVEAHLGAVMDASDLIALTERDLMGPLDARARALILSTAKRVSIVTAISPRAVVDLAFVLWQTTRLLRGIATLYGGRPGMIGMWGLARRILVHLSITGGIALGESVVQQIVGQGLAARLSARLGEGVVNGILTARVGIAAIDVCRPMDFRAEEAPVLTDFLSPLSKISGGKGAAS